MADICHEAREDRESGFPRLLHQGKDEQRRDKEKKMPERICRKCLLKDMTDSEYYKNVYEYIENLPEDLKADETTYKMRLDYCRSCRHLMNGMCRLCGCFVEIRAAKKENHCAESENVW